MIIPKLAGKDNRRDNSSDLFCILKICLIFFSFKLNLFIRFSNFF